MPDHFLPPSVWAHPTGVVLYTFASRRAALARAGPKNYHLPHTALNRTQTQTAQIPGPTARRVWRDRYRAAARERAPARAPHHHARNGTGHGQVQAEGRPRALRAGRARRHRVAPRGPPRPQRATPPPVLKISSYENSAFWRPPVLWHLGPSCEIAKESDRRIARAGARAAALCAFCWGVVFEKTEN